MINILTLFQSASLGATLFAICALSLIYWRAEDHKDSGTAAIPFMLAFLVLTFGLNIVDLIKGLGQSWPAFSGWDDILWLFLPVILWFYIDRLTRTEAVSRVKNILVWPCIATIAALPFLCFPVALRADLLSGKPVAMTPIIAGVLLGLGLSWLTGLLMYLGFAVAILRRLVVHRIRLHDIYSTKGRGELRGLQILLIAIFVAACLEIGNNLATLLGHPLLSDFAVAGYQSAAVFMFGLCALSQTSVLPDWSAEVFGAAQAPTEKAKGRYERSALTQEDYERILSRLDQTVTAQKLWRNPMLTLRDLAEAAVQRPNYASESLNAGRGVSFFDYINGWRITEACELLGTTSMTILEISEAVGFNAKSTFNQAFRKLNGMTPSNWRSTNIKINPTH
jgi:AraC-like DNA-binding protein